MSSERRALPRERGEAFRLGAFPTELGLEVHVWSDKARRVNIAFFDERDALMDERELERADGGAWRVIVAGKGAGARYRLRLDGELVVDPFARALPFGVHGPALVTPALRRRPHAGRAVDFSASEVLYELHVGAFSEAGTFRGVVPHLAALRELGVTVIELMPVAAFPGRRGWGYDGVGLFAPFASYGSPEDLNQLVDSAHALGLSIILDVVYNHLGPDGNYLASFSDQYFDASRHTPWGQGPALDAAPFRRLILENARHWLEDFGFDGLRLDAAHELEPGGEPHILADLARVAHQSSQPKVLIAEDDRNDPEWLFELGIDAVWSDDFHHSLHVLLTSERDGYYAGYQGDLEEVARVIERGQLYEGQRFLPSGKPRGKPAAGVPRQQLIYSLQNHDQIGNRRAGERLHRLSQSELVDAATVLLFFLSTTPLLFMGEEWRASAPFLYFSDHSGQLGEQVSRGRRAEFAHFAAFAAAEVPDPQDERTFQRSRLNWAEATQSEGAKARALHAAAIELRRSDPVLADPKAELRTGVQAGVLWVSRSNSAGERVLAFNPGAATKLRRLAERDLCGASLLFGSQELETQADEWTLPARSATVFNPRSGA